MIIYEYPGIYRTVQFKIGRGSPVQECVRIYRTIQDYADNIGLHTTKQDYLGLCTAIRDVTGLYRTTQDKIGLKRTIQDYIKLCRTI